MAEVISAYLIAALFVAIVFVIAFVLGLALRGARPFLNIIGMVIVAIALLEKPAGRRARGRPDRPPPSSTICYFAFSCWRASGSCSCPGRSRSERVGVRN